MARSEETKTEASKGMKPKLRLMAGRSVLIHGKGTEEELTAMKMIHDDCRVADVVSGKVETFSKGEDFKPRIGPGRKRKIKGGQKTVRLEGKRGGSATA